MGNIPGAFNNSEIAAGEHEGVQPTSSSEAISNRPTMNGPTVRDSSELCRNARVRAAKAKPQKHGTARRCGGKNPGISNCISDGKNSPKERKNPGSDMNKRARDLWRCFVYENECKPSKVEGGESCALRIVRIASTKALFSVNK